MSRTRARLEKLEAISAQPSRLVVVHGHSDAEHEAKIQALQARGEATERDLIVCIRLFSEPTGANHESV
jgi:hypothetical protein